MCIRESLTRQGTNWPAQLHRAARILKLRIYKLEVSFCLGSEKQRRWSDCSDAQLFAYGIRHIFSWPGSFVSKYNNVIWAASWHYRQNDLCTQRRLRSALASDQSPRYPPEESLGPKPPIKRTAKALIRLGGCPGWSVFAGRTCHFVEAAHFFAPVHTDQEIE